MPMSIHGRDRILQDIKIVTISVFSLITFITNAYAAEITEDRVSSSTLPRKSKVSERAQTPAFDTFHLVAISGFNIVDDAQTSSTTRDKPWKLIWIPSTSLIGLALASPSFSNYRLVPSATPQGEPESAIGPSKQGDEDERYRKNTKNLEIVYQALNIIDGGETIYCINRRRCHENNLLLGSHPSDGKIVAIKAATAVIHYLTYRLSQDNLKVARIFEYATIAVQGSAVIWNATICF